MRISERHRYDITSARVEQAKARNEAMLEVMSTQKRINKVTDDPVGLGRAVHDRNLLENNKQFQKNIDFSKGFLERTEAALTGIMDYLIRGKELAVGMANASYNADSRQAAAQEVKEMIEGVVALGNSSYGNRYIFGGFRTMTPPITQDGTYVGDDGIIFLQVDENNFKQINLQARELFETPAEDRARGHAPLVATLEMLYDGLMNNQTPTIQKAIDEMDYQMEKTSSFQSTLGAIHGALEAVRKRLDISGDLTAAELSKTEDTDLYQASSDFKRTETILQSTLMASNKLLQPSLLNFMQ